jgi:hypothetical protein
MIMEGKQLLNGKIQIKGYNHFGQVMEMCNRMGCLWQSGGGPLTMKISDHFKPGYVYIKEGIMTWDGRYDTHFEEVHRRFWRNPLPLVEV